MFIVKWKGSAPPDKDHWIAVLREVLANELGSYRVVFDQREQGWRFRLEWREDAATLDGEVIANTPESVAFNIYVGLTGAGKPIDPTWSPGGDVS